MTANAKNLSSLANALDDGTSGQFLQSTGSGGVVFADVAAGATVYDSAELLPLAGNSAGDMAYVTGTNRFYINNGSGWYSISLVNTNPNITSVQDASANTTPFTLATDGSATVITVTANDPEQIPLTFGYSVTSGSLTNGGGTTATVTQADNVFTVTPTTTEAYAGDFTLTFTASDGVNTATSANVFSLAFYILNSNYTTLLATAVDTSDNNNIIDSSSNNETITVYGNPSSGSFSPYRHGGYSWDFAGGSTVDATTNGAGIVSDNNSSAFNVGTNDYSIECWIKSRTSTTYTTNDFGRICDFHDTSTFALIEMRQQSNTGNLQVSENGTSIIITSSVQPFDGDWHFIQLIRTGGTTTVYIDGSSAGSAASTTNISAITRIAVGARNTNSYGFDGYIADFRFSNTARTAGIPTNRLTSDSNTKLLVCTKPYLVDESGTATSISLYSHTSRPDPSITPITPYDNLEYSAADHGGSVYFDQSSNLTLADNDNWDLTSSNFTIKFWVYMQQDTFPSGYIKWIDDNQSTTSTQGNWSLGVQSDKQVRLIVRDSSGTLAINTFSGTSKLIHNNRWYYVEWSGGTVKVNGETYISYTHPNTGAIGGNMVIGSGQNHEGTREAYMKGYIADLHFVNGSTAAESSIPTAPMSSVSDTKLLIKGTDASIIDKSQSTNLKLVGNTTGSTTQVKFANTKSMYFDGTGDYIKTPASTNYDLPADFTIEAWIYPTALTGNHLIVDTYDASQAGSYQFYWRSTGGGSLAFYTTGDLVVLQDPSGSNIQVNTWHHVAVARSGNTIRMFVDGTQVNSTTFTRDLTHGIPVAIGYQQATGTNYFAGYMQDVRITKGLARYTANFTPPTASLKG